MLTDELRKEIKQNRLWPTPMTSSDINQQHLTTQTTGGYNFNVQVDPSSRERSGSCSGDTMKIARGFDLERPAGENMSAEASAVEVEQQAGPSSIMNSRINQMNLEGSDEDSAVELTLSIGGSSSSSMKMPKKYSKQPHSEEFGCTNSSHRELDSSASFKSDNKGEVFSGPNTPISSSSSTFNQEKKRPHWLFQGLSINRT